MVWFGLGVFGNPFLFSFIEKRKGVEERNVDTQGSVYRRKIPNYG